MRRWPTIGLRARLVGALLITSALTLSAAALTLLQPLEHRLKREDLEFLTQATLATSPTLRELDPKELRPNAPELRSFARMLERRTGARVAVFDKSLRKLADTDPDADPNDARGGPFDDVVRAFQSRKRVRSTGMRAGTDVARIAIPIASGDTHLVVALRRSLEETHSAAQIGRAHV